MLRFWTSAVLMLGALLFAVPAQAQILPFEVRGGIGASGVTDPGTQLFDPARIRDANVELLFSVPPFGSMGLLGELRPHVGGTMSFSGQEHLAYAGLSWTFRAPLFPVFAEASVGGAISSGAWAAAGTPRRFGCTALGRASATIGVDVLPGASLMGTVAHVSDFGACGTPDNGRTDVMVRVGIRF